MQNKGWDTVESFNLSNCILRRIWSINVPDKINKGNSSCDKKLLDTNEKGVGNFVKWNIKKYN